MKMWDIGILFLLAAVWGASFLFVRVAVPVLRPFPLVVTRVMIAGGILLVFALLKRRDLQWWRWRQYLIQGILNNVIPFTLIALAQLHLTTSFAAMLNATTPLFSAIVAAIWLKDPLTRKKLLGLLFGIIGVGVIVGWTPLALDATGLLAVGAMLAAACSYGVASVYSKITFVGVHPLMITIGQLLSAGIVTLPLAVINPPAAELSGEVILALLGLATLSTAIAYLLYFRLIATAGPTIAASVTLIIPFFSSIWGAIFLGENLEVGQVVGFSIILVGLLLITGLDKMVFIKRNRVQNLP
jgi:drug/metabolite transporter (DMT)-like permease